MKLSDGLAKLHARAKIIERLCAGGIHDAQHLARDGQLQHAAHARRERLGVFIRSDDRLRRHMNPIEREGRQRASMAVMACVC